MSDVGQRERPVQDRVVLLFADRLGYRHLGNRQSRPGNSNIEQGNRFKEREVLGAVREELGEYETRADEVFEIVKNQREY